MATDQQTSSATTWTIIIVVLVIVIALGWWFFSQQNYSPANSELYTPTPSTQVQSSEKQITSFAFSGVSPVAIGTIDNAKYTVAVMVPKGTSVKNLTPTIAVSDNATISPQSGAVQDFTNPVTYTVTAQDGSMQTYTVTVKVSTT